MNLFSRSNRWSDLRRGTAILAALVLMMAGFLRTEAQVQLSNGTPSATTDFSNSMQTSVGSNPSTAYSGAGFDANPVVAGRLNSNAWAVTGWTDGALVFGGTRTTAATDYTRGSTAIAVSSGGMYAYTGSPASAANPFLMIQPGGTDWAPGTLTLRIQNTGTTNITELAVSYDIYIRNDQARSNSFNFSHSADNTTYTPMGALDYTSPAAAGVTTFELVGGVSPSRSTTITGLNILPGDYYYIRWSGADVGGSGSRDEFGLDNITTTATFASGSSTPTALAITTIAPSSPYANTSFDVTVRSVDGSSSPVNVVTNTDVVLSVNTGTGSLSGTLTGTILAGTNSVTITGLSYNVAENGVVLGVARTAGDVLNPGVSAAFNVLPTASQVAITSINGGNTVYLNNTFSVTVQSRDGSNTPAPVLAATTITLSVFTGTGALAGTVTGVIPAGQNTVTITGTLYNVAEAGVVLSAVSTSGDVLAAGQSAPFNVAFALAPGDLSIIGFNANTPDNFAFATWVDIPNGTIIKFTDGGFNNDGDANGAGAARGSENFVIWTNSTGLPVAAGTVVTITGLTANIGTASAGSVAGLNGLANTGDQIMAYMGPATSGANPDYSGTGAAVNFSGILIYGLTYGSSGWLTTGSAAAGTSYLPDEIDVANGNIAITDPLVATHGQYTGPRLGQLTFDGYKTLVNNPANWTIGTGSAVITLDPTVFTLASGSATKLVVTSVNGGTDPTQNSPFDVVIEAFDNTDTPSPVLTNTTVTLTLTTGTGVLGGTLTGVITAGSNIVTITGVTYNTAEAGVVINAAATAGDVLTADNSDAFTVLAAASQLAYVNLSTFAFTGNVVQFFSVEARRPDNTVDVTYSGDVTVTLTTGTGAIIGTLTETCISGSAFFNDIAFDTPGIKVITATSGSLAAAVSPNITVSTAALTDVVVPQYMQGKNGTNSNRIPTAAFVTLSGLQPSTTYRYTNACVLGTDAATDNGAGNPIYVNPAGFVRSTSASLSTAGGYGEFTTDATGTYSGWFVSEPTGNARFTPGNDLHYRININNGAGGTFAAVRLTTTATSRVLDYTDITSQGTALRGTSGATPRNFVAVYDNTSGSGMPVSCTFVESDGSDNSVANSYSAFYGNNVNGVAGAYGTIVPNNLPSGIRRIEQLSITDASAVGCPATDSDGVWGSTNTVNPSSGGTALVINAGDAPLDASSAPASISASSTTVCIGAPTTLSVVGGSLGINSTWVWYSGSCGGTQVGTGASIVVAPTSSTTYFVRAEDPCGTMTSCVSQLISVSNCPGNDARSNAFVLATSGSLTSCTSVSADLTLATVSPEANSTAITGEDVWYMFTATEPGIRLEANSASVDLLVELQDAGGSTIDTENVQSGIGNEALNFGGLTVGQTYYIAVRNYNAGSGTGSFTLCAKRLQDTGCNYGPGPYANCSVFKANSVFATSYTFNCTSNTTSQLYTGTVTGTTVITLGFLPANDTYTVTIDATYTLLNGAGAPEQVTVVDQESCTLIMAQHPDLDLRSTDACPVLKYPYSIIGANQWICGSSYYEWQFFFPGQYLSPVATVNGPAGSRYLNLSSVSLPANASGQYEVQVRPWFAGGTVAGDWGTDYQCLQLPVAAPMVLEGENGQPILHKSVETETGAVSMTVYPNPNRGEQLVVGLEGWEGLVQVRITDMTGRTVLRDNWNATDGESRVFHFAQQLTDGMYVVELNNGSQVITQRFVVQH